MDNFEIKYAGLKHLSFLMKNESKLSQKILEKKINNKEVIIVESRKELLGWLRYNFFWDEIPFLNILFILEKYRGKGYGRALIEFWEKSLLEQGYQRFLTSTLAYEAGQQFFRKIGYIDIGGFILPEETSELILMKEFSTILS